MSGSLLVLINEVENIINDYYVDVVYDGKTGEVVAIKDSYHWIIPSNCKVAHFENGVVPYFVNNSRGNVCLKPNTIILCDY